MSKNKRILIAEDQPSTAKYFGKILKNAGYEIEIVSNGIDAYELLKQGLFDALLTDWLMPDMDGIELVKKCRAALRNSLLIFMVAARTSEEARQSAMDAGVDEYITKPVTTDGLLNLINTTFQRIEQKINITLDDYERKQSGLLPPFIGVVIASSTGGPPTLVELFKLIEPTNKAVFYIVQHGPAWMLESFAKRLSEETNFCVELGSDGKESVPGTIYLAPGNTHLLLEQETFRLIISHAAAENFVRPAADPLFRSAANAFSQFCLCVVLTGLGSDGTKGAAIIAANKGKILIQKPETAIAPSMPRSIVETKIQHESFSIPELAEVVNRYIFMNSALLVKKHQDKNN